MAYVDLRPSARIVVYGDSIAVGYASTNPATDAWPVLLSADYPGMVRVIAYSGRQLRTDGLTAAWRVNLAQQLVQAARGTNSRRIWLAIGTNDYGVAQWNSTDFGSAYADLLDQIRALDTTVAVYAQSPLVRTTETANALGSTLPNYRTAISSACTGRSWATFVDGSAILALGDLVDGVHPTTAGHVKYKAAAKTALGY